MPVSRRSPRVAAATVVGALATLAAGLVAPAQAAEQPDAEGSRFTLAVLPDTQFYSRYAYSHFEPMYGTNPFAVQTQWLAEHADELNIPFVAHLGDVVDQVGVQDQWVAADSAMQTLDDAGVPYSVLAGNHDVLDASDDRYDDTYDLDAEPYLDWFGPTRADGQPTDGGTDPTGMNQFQIIEAEGQRLMVLALSWRASAATLTWANEVIASHPELPVILTSHDIIGIESDGATGVTSENGQRLWDELIAANDQIFITLNGHFHGAAVTERTNDAGNTVTQVLIDYQMAYEGGNGYLSLFEFDLTNDRIDVETLSPWVVQKPPEALTSHDVAVLDGPAQQFSLDIDFSERFAGFAPEFGPGDGQWPSLSDRAVQIVTDGFEGRPGTSEIAPGSTQDYVQVPGTLAHWRMTGESGVLPGGGVIEDVAGENDLYRVPVAESGSAAAEPGDVSIVSESYPYSASGQAVCFAGSDQQTGRFSYLSTEQGAAVNDADFSDGYTIETFMSMDESWTAEANAWSKFLVRSGNRSQLDGMPWSQWDYTASPAALGISSLREFQWTEIGQDATQGDKTNWSGEIMVDTWHHVAVVNDPATAETTMYVDGAPVLRTAQDTIGQSFNEGMPWIVGADWVDDAATNGWNGCVGETRIIDRPTGPGEWLTARPDLTGFEVTEAPAQLTAEATAVVLEGLGAPRATVSATVDADGPVATPAAQSEAAHTEAARSPRTTIAADGSWSLTIPSAAFTGGSGTISLVQGFGTRTSQPVTITIELIGDQTGPADPEEPQPTDAPPSGDPGADPTAAPGADAAQPGEGDAPADTADPGGGLASTGSALPVWALLAVAGLLGAGLVLVRRARRAPR